MASSWQGSHYVVVAGAAALAFAAGYTMGGQRARPPVVAVGNDSAGPGFPGYETNETAPPPPTARRGRPDENQLIADNAEPEDGQQRPQGGQGGRSGRGSGGRGEEEQGGGDQGEQQPPDEGYEQGGEQNPYGPEGE